MYEEGNKQSLSKIISKIKKLFNFSRVILVVSRSDWLQRLQDDNGTSLSELYAAIIIVDDNDACPKVNENCYRPSYPISDLM